MNTEPIGRSHTISLLVLIGRKKRTKSLAGMFAGKTSQADIVRRCRCSGRVSLECGVVVVVATAAGGVAKEAACIWERT